MISVLPNLSEQDTNVQNPFQHIMIKTATLHFIFYLFLIPLVCNQSSTTKIPIETKQSGKEYRLIKLHYENTSGEKAITTFFYDENGLNQRARWELLDGTRSSENYHTLDKNGRLLVKYREFSDGVISTVRYNYNKNGNLISEYFERSDSVTGEVHYEYNSKGKLINAECRGLNGWFFGVITYTYQEDGLMISGELTKDVKPIGTISYQYDEFGNLKLEFWDFLNSWSQTFLYEYEKI